MPSQQRGYKKQRSKSCINKCDNIFSGLPRSKERVVQQTKDEATSAQPKQPTQARKREKSSIIEMKELKRLCLEELKRDLQAGKIEGLPTTSSAAFASNKRQSNLNSVTNKKEQNQS